MLTKDISLLYKSTNIKKWVYPFMRDRGSWGICNLCGCDFSKAGMTRHLESCIRKKLRARDEQEYIDTIHKDKHYHIRVDGRGLPDYWMHLQVRADASLEDLDDFLRDTWLECCGHLSAFTIRGNRYASDPIDDLDEVDMKAPKLDQVKNIAFKILNEHPKRMQTNDPEFFNYIVAQGNTDPALTPHTE